MDDPLLRLEKIEQRIVRLDDAGGESFSLNFLEDFNYHEIAKYHIAEGNVSLQSCDHFRIERMISDFFFAQPGAIEIESRESKHSSHILLHFDGGPGCSYEGSGYRRWDALVGAWIKYMGG